MTGNEWYSGQGYGSPSDYWKKALDLNKTTGQNGGLVSAPAWNHVGAQGFYDSLAADPSMVKGIMGSGGNLGALGGARSPTASGPMTIGGNQPQQAPISAFDQYNKLLENANSAGVAGKYFVSSTLANNPMFQAAMKLNPQLGSLVAPQGSGPQMMTIDRVLQTNGMSTASNLMAGQGAAATAPGSSPLMNALQPSVPISLSQPISQLNGQQQGRIGQAMGDMSRINEARARVGYDSVAQPANASFNNSNQAIDANNQLRTLSGGMNFQNQLGGMQYQGQQNASNLLQQLIGPMMATLNGQAGMPRGMVPGMVM